MSKKQLKIQAFKKGLLHPYLTHDATAEADFSSLRCIDKHFVSAYEALAVLESALRQWASENDSVEGAFPVFDVRALTRLLIESVVLDLSSLEAKQEPASPVPPVAGVPPHPVPEQVGSDPATPDLHADDEESTTDPGTIEEPREPIPPRPVVDPTVRRNAILRARDILQAFAQGELLTFEDVDEQIQDSSDPALVRDLVTRVRRRSVTSHSGGDIEWGDVVPLKQKLPMRTELIVDAQWRDMGRLDSRRLQLVVKEVRTPQYKTAVELSKAKVSGAFPLRYGSLQLACRIMLLTAAGFDIQYRATVMRGLAGDAKFEFLASQADPIVDGQARLGMSDQDLLDQLLIDALKKSMAADV